MVVEIFNVERGKDLMGSKSRIWIGNKKFISRIFINVWF